MSSPTHKPRKRRKDVKSDLPPQQNSSFRVNATSDQQSQKPAFPLQAFFWPSRGGISQWIVLPLALMVVGLFRWTAGFWGYSGFQSPPMHGDFEAQRHWMEITTQLPISQWYFHDLEWWGLDYPPLTAYHSWLLGNIGALIDPSWFALYTSRGLDDPLLKVYMRTTVIISEYLIYVPATVLFCRFLSHSHHTSSWQASVALAAILLQPGTILIDHAHFQYNTVMLGFTVAATRNLLAQRFAWSCVFFVAALTFKQMALYYAPAFFAYLLGSCISPRLDVGRFVVIAVTTLLSFGAAFAPIILAALYESYFGLYDARLPHPPLMSSLRIPDTSILHPVALQLTQAIHRIFPFARGLFEDKVANFWCSLHTVHKLTRYPLPTLQLASLTLTLASIGPPCLALASYPNRRILLPALAATSYGFFLFSFQVHEKSILLPLLPVTLMLAERDGFSSRKRGWVAFANVLGCWTMFPLLKRDGLTVPYVVLTLLWGWLVGVPGAVAELVSGGWIDVLTGLIHAAFYAIMLIWHGFEAGVEPWWGKRDLWVVVNACVGFAGVVLCYLWCLWGIWEGFSRPREASGKKKA